VTHNENGINDSLAVTKYHKFHDQTENNCLSSAVMAVFRMHQGFFPAVSAGRSKVSA